MNSYAHSLAQHNPVAEVQQAGAAAAGVRRGGRSARDGRAGAAGAAVPLPEHRAAGRPAPARPHPARNLATAPRPSVRLAAISYHCLAMTSYNSTHGWPQWCQQAAVGLQPTAAFSKLSANHAAAAPRPNVQLATMSYHCLAMT